MAHPVARPRRLLALAATVVAALSLAGVAQAQTYTLVASDVQVDVRPDGSVAVDEDITVAFSGSFTYGFREIPLRSGERIDEVGVSEKGSPISRAPRPSSSPAGRRARSASRISAAASRVVWRFESDGFQERTFRVHYRLSGLAVGYDDVVDVNLKVWGDEWEQRLGRLTATMRGARRRRPRLGPSVWVRGDVTLQGRKRAAARARRRRRAVRRAARAVSARAFTSTAGMQVREGDGLQADHRGGDGGRGRLRERPGADRRRDLAARGAGCSCCSLGTLPGSRDRRLRLLALRPRARTGYDREYEQEPPTETAPALVPTLLRQGGEAGSFEFTATLFDLIRRGIYKAEPVDDGAERLGRPPQRAGLRSRALAGRRRRAHDLGDRGDARRRRRPLDGPRPALEASATRSRTSAPRWHRTSTAFKENVGSEVGDRRLVPLARRRPARRRRSSSSPRSARSSPGSRSTAGARVYPRWSDVVLLGLASRRSSTRRCCSARSTQRKLWRRRTPEASARGRALGGVPALPHGLPAAPGGAAGDARALGAATSSTGSRSGSPTGCSRQRTSRCPRQWPRRLDLLDLGRRRPRQRRLARCRSATSIRSASAPRSRPLVPARAAVAAASRAAAEAGGGGGGGGSAGRADASELTSDSGVRRRVATPRRARSPRPPRR